MTNLSIQGALTDIVLPNVLAMPVCYTLGESKTKYAAKDYSLCVATMALTTLTCGGGYLADSALELVGVDSDLHSSLCITHYL